MEIIEPVEFWKDIKGYENNYQIGSCGNIRNKITNKNLVGDVNSTGYKRVVLYTPIKQRFFIHRLVASHFVDGYDENLVVNHIDGNKQNNSVKNLEWVTRSENDLHAYRLGLRDAHPAQFRHKIESYDIKSGNPIKIYNNAQECADELKVARANIYSCCNGVQKSCRKVGLRYV